MTSVWVSVEGLNGVGKTYLTTRLAHRLGPECRLVTELTDQENHRFTGQVITALTRPGRTFLRTGHPLTETFALLALKVHEYEQIVGGPAVVVEDRGVDTVAVYQAAILADTEPAAMRLVADVHAVAAVWRPLPRLTLLLVDDLDACLARFAARLGVPVPAEDRDLLARVERLYARLAAEHPDRIRVVDRSGRSTDDVLDELHAQVRTVLTGVSVP